MGQRSLGPCDPILAFDPIIAHRSLLVLCEEERESQRPRFVLRKGLTILVQRWHMKLRARQIFHPYPTPTENKVRVHEPLMLVFLG